MKIKKGIDRSELRRRLRNRRTLSRVWEYVSRYRLFIVISLFLAAFVTALGLYVPILAGRAIDNIAGPGRVDFPGLISVLIRIAWVIAVTALGQWIMNAVNNRITYNVVRDIRSEAFGHITRLPLSYIDSHPGGDIVSRVIADADQFSDGLLMGFTQFFSGVMTIIGTLFFMFSINASIAVAVIILTPLSLFVAKFIASHTYEMFRVQSETRGEQTAGIDEVINNLKVVKAFSREGASVAEFDEVNERLYDHSLKALFFSSITNPATRFVNNIVYAVVTLTGVFVCLGAGIPGTLTVGQLAGFLSYANQYTKPFNEISGVIAELQNAIACAQRLLDLIDAPEEAADGDKSLDNAEGRVELSDVYFSYDPKISLIEGLDLRVEPGCRTAIVGRTGCGKTTLINLLMRFYDVDSGRISVDGMDIRDIKRSDLRRSYGMVLQDTWLSSGTIRENIAMGKPDATDEEIIEAAKAAHSYGFIRRLPKGLDTVIAPDGGSLSEGQKQLLCITRVMLALPPMLILDEATSSIDTRTELRIQQAFTRLMQGRTSFIVAHRLSTIRNADNILVMDKGHIIEQGTHEELMAKQGFYSELYNSQFNADDV